MAQANDDIMHDVQKALNQGFPMPDIDVHVKQEPGQSFHWIEPGPIRLSTYVHGTPDAPRRTGDHWKQ